MPITEEELRRMSPEQILQLQKQNCVFCQIIAGKIPAKKIYENNTVIALLDINPANAGHVILLPREHYQIMALMPDDAIGEFFAAAKLISRSILKAMKSQGTTIFAANGTVAGQRAPHFMLHIIPRFEGDNLGLRIPVLNADQSSASGVVRAKVKDVFGAETVEAEFEEVSEIQRISEHAQKPSVSDIKTEPSVIAEKKAEKEEKKEKKEKISEGKKAEKEASRVNLDDLADFLSEKGFEK